MAIIKCKMCGGDLVLVEGQSVAECEYCGSKQTVPAADNEKKLNLFASANKLRAACEFDRAAGVYDAIKAEFPSEAEAYWGLVLCKYGIEYVDDPATGKKVPTCHRLSFDSVMDDSNLEMAMDCADAVARKVYREEAKHLEQIRTGILEVSSNEKPYDIFICYKETDENGDRTLDSVLAQDLYSALTEKGYRVFFSRITLQSKLGEAYEPCIFAALNSAKVMLAVGTDPDYYSAVWVKNEWSRYLKICAEDKSKHLIPCYKGLDAYDMPREFRPLQGVDLGKMGAVQDILFNMEKYIPLQKQTTTVIQEKVVVGGTGGSNKIASLLDRGNMALEDGDWAKADSFFEDVLNNDSKNAQAYLGKTLAQEKCRTMDALVRKRRDTHQNVCSEKMYIGGKTAHITEMAKKFSLLGYVKQSAIRDLYSYDLSYTSQVSGWEKEYREEENWWKNHRWLSRAEKFASGAVAETIQNEKKHLFAQLNDRVKKAQEADVRAIAKLEVAYDAHIVQADVKAEKLYNDGLACREQEYQKYLCMAKNEESIDLLKKAEIFFRNNRAYKDSKKLIEHCEKRIADLTAEKERKEAERRAAEAAQAERQRILAKEEAERQRVIAEQKRKAQQKRKKTIAVIAAVCVVLAVAVSMLVTKVIIPANNYKRAEVLLEKGKTAEAAMVFGALGDYKDARDRSLDYWSTAADRENVSAGINVTVGLKTNGTVVAAGDNDDQYSGPDWNDIVAISAGRFHTVGLKKDGTVVTTKCSGEADFGQDFLSKWNDIVAISAGGTHTVGLKTDGTVVATTYIGADEFNYGQCDVSGWDNIVAVSAGDGHTVGLKADGTVVAVGWNENGQCDVSDWTDIVSISAGITHTVGLKSDGTVIAVGGNDDGLSKMSNSNWRNIISVSAGMYHTVGLNEDGTVVARVFPGNKDYDKGQCEVSGWTDIVAISAGRYHTVGLKEDGTVVVAGENDYGQCEVSGWENIKIPAISEEKLEGMAVAKQEREERLAAEKKAEEERLAKEYAAAEELANNGETAKAALAFSKLGDYRDAKARCLSLWDASDKGKNISAGWYHTVGLKDDGTVIAVGAPEGGRCDVSSWKNIKAISAGGYYTVGLQSDGTVVAVGFNDYNQLNVDDWADIVRISSGTEHTVGLKADGTVVAVGSNKYGQCNVSDWTDIIAVETTGCHTFGLKSDGTVVKAGEDTGCRCDIRDWQNITAINAQINSIVGLKEDGTVVEADCFYGKRYDISSWTDIVDVDVGSWHAVGLKSDGTVVAAEAADRPDYEKMQGQCNVDGWRDIVSISAGSHHTVGLKKDGAVLAVGYNLSGQCDVRDWSDIKLPE